MVHTLDYVLPNVEAAVEVEVDDDEVVVVVVVVVAYDTHTGSVDGTHQH